MGLISLGHLDDLRSQRADGRAVLAGDTSTLLPHARRDALQIVELAQRYLSLSLNRQVECANERASLTEPIHRAYSLPYHSA
jgi:hypothetical protein